MIKKYSELVKKLKKEGYRCSHYSDTSDGNALVYWETDSKVLKVKYEWIKVGENRYTSGNIIKMEDVTESYI